MKRWWLTSIAVTVLVLGVAAVGWSRVAPAGSLIPTAPLQRGQVAVRVNAIGDLRATRSTQFFVPPMGNQLTILTLANSGTAVKAGDVIAEFDASEQEFALEQAQFDLQLADQEIAKAEAEAAVLAADDEVSLLTARFNVRRAELDAKANELVGSLVAKQNLMLLEEAKGKLAALEKEVQSHRETSKASTAMIRERRTKAMAAVATATRNINNLKVLAPFDGFVSVRQNMNALGGIVFFGASMPDFKPGDATNSGTLFAELIDTSRVEVTAKLAEADRANVSPGQRVDITVDAAPDIQLQGKVRSVSSVASRQMFEGGERRFDIAFDVEGAHERIRPGVSAALSIAGAVFEAALHVPRAAIFDVSGQPTVYVKTANGFEPRSVKLRARTETLAMIEGLEMPAEVALVNPSKAPAPNKPASSVPSTPQPGR
ncbi:MAG: HlyD family efflux transporter periplasmic adaptor subunit [Cyanobacteria bacterium]|nr:HlyD family efflux transporter periplasmic adaptor subunit [Cyanobacteriota bacterium]